MNDPLDHNQGPDAPNVMEGNVFAAYPEGGAELAGGGIVAVMATDEAGDEVMLELPEQGVVTLLLWQGGTLSVGADGGFVVEGQENGDLFTAFVVDAEGEETIVSLSAGDGEVFAEVVPAYEDALLGDEGGPDAEAVDFIRGSTGLEPIATEEEAGLIVSPDVLTHEIVETFDPSHDVLDLSSVFNELGVADGRTDLVQLSEADDGVTLTIEHEGADQFSVLLSDVSLDDLLSLDFLKTGDSDVS